MPPEDLNLNKDPSTAMNEKNLSLHPMTFEEALKALSNTEPPVMREGSQAEESGRTITDASRSPEPSAPQSVPRPTPDSLRYMGRKPSPTWWKIP